MNAKVETDGAVPSILSKQEPSLPAIVADPAGQIAIRTGTVFAGHAFVAETVVPTPPEGFQPGTDYLVAIDEVGRSSIRLANTVEACAAADVLGGFHYAPGGNAVAREGGTDQPAINPYSIWDIDFRPACPDPRGMVCVRIPNRLPGLKPCAFWCDIYLLGSKHLTDGTSRLGATIADGNDCPEKPSGGKFRKFDYETAVEVMKHHGKGLLSFEEFAAAAYGVTEKTAHDGDPSVTKLDAPRTSRWGLMQATGNLWVWGHDGDPDLPRASILGGSWWNGVVAGSRHASVAYGWPESSLGYFGARGRCDHLMPA